MGRETAGKGPFQHKGPAKGIRGNRPDEPSWLLEEFQPSATRFSIHSPFHTRPDIWGMPMTFRVGCKVTFQKQLVLPRPATARGAVAACLFANAALC